MTVHCSQSVPCFTTWHWHFSLSAPFMPAFEGFQPDNGLLTNAGTTCAFNSRSVCPLEGSTYSEEKLIIKEWLWIKTLSQHNLHMLINLKYTVDVDVLEFIEWSEHLYLYVAFSIKTAQSRVALSFYSSGCITLYSLCVCGYLPSMHSTLIFSYIKYICMFLYIYLAAAAHTFHETHWC